MDPVCYVTLFEILKHRSKPIVPATIQHEKTRVEKWFCLATGTDFLAPVPIEYFSVCEQRAGNSHQASIILKICVLRHGPVASERKVMGAAQ
jgi:hypothetical protein